MPVQKSNSDLATKNAPTTAAAKPSGTLQNPLARKAAQNLSQAINPMREMKQLQNEARNYFQGWLQKLGKFRNIEENNYDLGHQHLQLGNFSDAIFRFKFVTWMNPTRADAWYYLGCSYLANNNKKLARPALEKAVSLKADYQEAVYMLAVLSDKKSPAKQLPKTMPLGLAREFFDTQATNFTYSELEEKGYEGHVFLSSAIRSQLVPGRMDHVILELGVGTGLCGSSLRDVASHITGVDISEAMLKEAVKLSDKNGKKTYDALIHRDAAAFLKDAPEDGYDMVIASNLFSYMGDVQAVFEAVPRILKAGGLFAFSADKLGNGNGYSFDPMAARFHFSATYLDELAVKQGLTKIKIVENNIYPEYPAWVCLFKK